MGSVLCNNGRLVNLVDLIGSKNYLANHCTSKAAIGSPLQFCDPIFLVGTDCLPEGCDTLSVRVVLGLWGQSEKCAVRKTGPRRGGEMHTEKR